MKRDMEMNSDTYELICEQLKQCLLPELDREIGNEPLHWDDFGIFRYGLEKNLQLLFDIISKNERLIREPFDKNDNTFRVHFILLLHQQSGNDEAPFQIANESISKQIRFLIEKYYKQLISVPDIHSECLEYYKKRLTPDKWKRNVGAVYGFVQMYKLHQQLVETKLKTADECLFMLSVGMLLVDYFEVIYKGFGLILFDILIDSGNPNDLKRLNLYEVIYKKLMNPLINVLKDEVTTTLLLTCLYKCVRQFKGWSNPSKWNEMDDVLDDVMKRIVFETDNRSAAILYLFVAKLTLLPMKIPQIVSNQMDIKHLDRTIGNVDKCSDSERSEQYDKLRDIFQMHHNLPIARWSKKLLEVFTQRAIVGHAEEIRFQIHVLHISYLCCFYGNPLFVRMKWSDALHDIVKTMMELVANNINYNVFVGEIFELLKTFKLHLEHVNPRLDPLEAYKYDLSTADGRKQAEDVKTHANLNEIEQNVIEFRKSIDDIVAELKSYCLSKKSSNLE